MSSRSSRGVAPVVGVVVLVAVTVLLAAVVGAFAIGLGSGADDTPTAAITAHMKTVEYGNKEINLTHEGGDALDVRDLTIRIFVGGQPLEFQPDVPAAGGMKGFYGFPGGPFSQNKDNRWTTGEVASLTIAGTNSPQPTDGADVIIKIYSGRNIVTTARV